MPISFSPFLSKWRKIWKSDCVKLLVFCQCIIPHGFNFFWNPQFVLSKKIWQWPSFQVRKLGPSKKNILSILKKSLKLIDFFEILKIIDSLGPSSGPGSWVIAKFSYFTQIEDFIKNSIHGEYIDKIQKASHGHIFTFCVNRISTSKRNILVKVRVVLK